ncbi:MAG: Rrf2 family transcriptional regulator [Verrucomicrobiaceae bacterium]|uniref:RrF2 family transcriptional regulator n=1 Tax=Aestuariivirga sp. TaxID=2650926 RepID=UPI003017B135
MRLTSYSDYALRMLIYVAVHPDQFVTISEIAKSYGISKNHLMKIANELAVAGVLEAVRGRNGGLRLARPAEDISIGAVLRMTESRSDLVECFDPATNTCVITRACRLKHLLAQALEAFYLHLDAATLADLARQPKSILSLLSV